MRLFLANPEQILSAINAAKAVKVTRPVARREIKFLKKIGLLKRGRKAREAAFQLNPLFPYIRALRSLIVESASVSRDLLLKRFKGLGRGVKFVALSGSFIGGTEGGELDILAVGDNIRRAKLEKIIGKIESEIGKELKYVLFDTQEFKYRRGMYDRFVMDILNKEHDILIDNLGA